VSNPSSKEISPTTTSSERVQVRVNALRAIPLCIYSYSVGAFLHSTKSLFHSEDTSISSLLYPARAISKVNSVELSLIRLYGG